VRLLTFIPRYATSASVVVSFGTVPSVKTLS